MLEVAPDNRDWQSLELAARILLGKGIGPRHIASLDLQIYRWRKMGLGVLEHREDHTLVFCGLGLLQVVHPFKGTSLTPLLIARRHSPIPPREEPMLKHKADKCGASYDHGLSG